MNRIKQVVALFLITLGMNAFGQKAAPEGAINGLFSVGNGRQVYFSKGNLQYQASTNTWRFAENQWDYVGGSVGGRYCGNVAQSSNDKPSSTYSGWIDLFGWGTSGYAHGAVCYQPWSTSGNENDYQANGSIKNSLGGQADWGYNPISNGGNAENQWRTLSEYEWEFLMTKRNTASGMRYVNASVNNVIGFAILPDNWDVSYCELKPSGSGINCFTVEDWVNKMESHGAVFLPGGGERDGNTIYGAGRAGNYWTSTCDPHSDTYTKPYKVPVVSFQDKSLCKIITFGMSRSHGYSVRLVYCGQ